MRDGRAGGEAREEISGVGLAWVRESGSEALIEQSVQGVGWVAAPFMSTSAGVPVVRFGGS